MLKIGIVDYYLDNWHANYFPGFLREAIDKYGYDAALTHAYAVKDCEWGMSTDEWCRRQEVQRARSMEELIDSVDAIMVIAADNAAFHPIVCPLPLSSGKPVFVDKTFAPDVATAKMLFALAREHGTPVFSSSAQRYCQSLMDYMAREGGRTRFMSTVGPHDLSSYAVHQFEPIVTVMGVGVKRVKAFAVGEAVTQLILDYGDGRMASFMQTPNPYAEFNFMVSDGTKGERLKSEDYYINTMRAILDFFISRIPPVTEAETLEVLGLIEAAKRARQCPDTWLDLSEI